MNIKNFAIAAAMGAAALTAGQAMAAELKIATLDAQQVINDTNAAKRAVSSLQAKRDAAQKQIDGMEAPLLEKRKKLAADTTLTGDKAKAAEESFGKEVAEFREKAINIQRDLDQANLTARKQIADAVKSAVDAISKEKGFDLVIPKSVILYNTSNVPDISAETLKRANALLDK
ncbi:MAG TPA: OmpH family outer membrane protein [Alphaproteobacteria bacterium]|nr:OmpH family outer membrane protein [Alphaproteobacteria bacterium]